MLYLSSCTRCSLFFFFQAEDGIRDWSVTGVQTCALPIYTISTRAIRAGCEPNPHKGRQTGSRSSRTLGDCRADARSEERRVGKECRSRWSSGPGKKNKKKRHTGEQRCGK